jgi:hypothetical protein
MHTDAGRRARRAVCAHTLDVPELGEQHLVCAVSVQRIRVGLNLGSWGGNDFGHGIAEGRVFPSWWRSLPVKSLMLILEKFQKISLFSCNIQYYEEF